jgi:hypothetical protein
VAFGAAGWQTATCKLGRPYTHVRLLCNQSMSAAAANCCKAYHIVLQVACASCWHVTRSLHSACAHVPALLMCPAGLYFWEGVKYLYTVSTCEIAAGDCSRLDGTCVRHACHVNWAVPCVHRLLIPMLHAAHAQHACQHLRALRVSCRLGSTMRASTSLSFAACTTRA